MLISGKFYARFGEALKHLRIVERVTPFTSPSAESHKAVSIRIQGPHGVQVLQMSALEAEIMGRQLIEYAGKYTKYTVHAAGCLESGPASECDYCGEPK